jgi:peptidoglycan/xylan/chitin deacetylase (PgdA/CDA1 family)
MVPAGFVDEAPAKQRDYAAAHAIHAATEYADERIALSWHDVRDLDQTGHVIGCHTMHHTRLRDSLTPTELELEIVASKKRLERELDRVVDVFAWVGGEEWAYSRAAAQLIELAGFRYSFMTNNALFGPGDDPLHIQRTNLEADYPESVVGFQLSGLLDLFYAPKRRRVNRVTAPAAEGQT